MTTKSARVQEIYDFVLPEMEANGIEDTTQNRLWFLQGLQAGWEEEENEFSMEKSLYMLALSGEIMILQMQLSPFATFTRKE